MTQAEAPLPSIPAATLVIFRKGADDGAPELLMVQRSHDMRFAGGKAVFPGGRIDPADHDLAAGFDLPEDAEEPGRTAARVAALRETLEETGLLVGIDAPVTAAEAIAARAALLGGDSFAGVLDRLGRRLVPEALVPFARWCPNFSGAFDTHFFLTDLGTGAVEVEVDATENTHLFWASAAQSLAKADAGEISVIYPTRRNLERLAQFASFTEAAEHARATPIRTIAPRRIQRDGAMHLCIPDGLGYPVTSQVMTTVQRR
jgi:8-oxo-dGTP pyrophosphatase MutT (NUDIX family)